MRRLKRGMEAVIWELAVIIGVAVLFALFARLVKQPSIVAYLITGIVVGPLFFGLLRSHELIDIFAHLGVAFFLFIIGLSLDFRVLREMVRPSLFIGIGQVLVTSIIGFGLALWFGFSYTPALYIAAALAFSSTVVVMKMLSDKNELDSLHGKIAIGILIVQDFIAALVILVLPVIGTGDFLFVFAQILRGLFLVIFVFLISYLLIPGILSIAAKSQEVLLLFSLGWAVVIAALFSFAGFPIELGTLIAGMSLASSRFSIEISSKIKGLREFFVIVHLIFFGSLLVGPISGELVGKAVALSALVLVGNPLVVMSIMKAFGYKKRTNFFTGVSVAQISEFSLVLVFLGFSLGVLGQEVLSLIILVALITIGLSSYGIFYSHKLFGVLSPMLGIFDGRKKEPGNVSKSESHEIILFGYNRVGFNLVKAFDESGKKYTIVDYNPKTINSLIKEGVRCIYGDANDIELLKDLRVEKAKIVISTIPELETNLNILRRVGSNSVFIPTSHSMDDTKKLYSAGAHYVLMPHFLGGEHMAHLLVKTDFDRTKLKKEGEKHRKEIYERIILGHDHPSKEKHGD